MAVEWTNSVVLGIPERRHKVAHPDPVGVGKFSKMTRKRRQGWHKELSHVKITHCMKK